MFDRLPKTFLTVETGEAYQPIRLTYQVTNPEEFAKILSELKCVQKNAFGTSWNWYWQDEVKNLNFESFDAFQKNSDQPIRLATLTLKDNHFYISLSSFKRACLAVPFFHQFNKFLKIQNADFINKVFSTDERLPHGISELFKNEELDKVIQLRNKEYKKIQEQCENADTPEAALHILATYTEKEAKKKLGYAERYDFKVLENEDQEVIFLSFYIFMRSRELVAIKRWFGETGYTISDAADETVEQIFGNMGIDLLE